MNKFLDRDIYEGFIPLSYVMDGWNGTRPIFEELINEVQPTTIIEVGTWLGQSAFTMADALHRLGLTGIIICVDTWLGSEEFYEKQADHSAFNLRSKWGYPRAYDQFISNVIQRGLQDTIVPCPLPSRQAARLLAKHTITAPLIYIDGNHGKEDVKDDLISYWPLVDAPGILFGDDYNELWPGLMQAVENFGVPFEQRGNFWVMYKKVEDIENGVNHNTSVGDNSRIGRDDRTESSLYCRTDHVAP